MDEDIVAYIREARSYGHNDEEIRRNLLTVGWNARAVDNGFAEVDSEQQLAKAAASPPAAPVASVSISETGARQEPTLLPQPPHGKKSKRWLMLVGTGMGVIVVGAGVLAAVYAPARVFNRFINEASSKSHHTKFVMSYTDGGTAELPSDLGLALSNLAFEISGTGEFRAIESGHSASQGEINYNISGGGSNFGTALKYRQIDQDIYLNTKDNILLNLFYLQARETKKDWAKMNFHQLVREPGGGQTSALMQILDAEALREKINDIWLRHQIIKLDKYLGIERVNNTQTFHFRLALDRPNIERALKDTAALLSETDSQNFSNDLLSAITSATTQLLSRLETREFEVWVGILDQRPYRIHFVGNAPSLISLLKLSMAGLRFNPGSDDSQRLAHVRQIAGASELYYNDTGGYPQNLSDLSNTPKDKPAYLALLPVAPPPSGLCTEAANTYTYTPVGGSTTGRNGARVYPNYQLIFCLGDNVGEYKAGLGILTPSGISTAQPCPANSPNCLLPAPREQAQGRAFDQVDFSAELKFDIDYSDYGNQVTVEAPTDFIDLNEMIKQQRQFPLDASNALPLRN